jgi:hypothetical protein
MKKIDDFYYVDKILLKYPIREIDYMIKLKHYLQLAKIGDRNYESQLCNLLGTLRRSIQLDILSPCLQTIIKQAVQWLQTTGRKIDFSNPDPALWITKRNGKPRF